MGLVGRDDELRAVADVLHRLEELPRAVVLSGEAGIGKTSLWSAGLDSEVRGYRVLRTRPSEAETGFAFEASPSPATWGPGPKRVECRSSRSVPV